MHLRGRVLLALTALAALLIATASPASADGTETLGTPSIPIAPGTGVAVGGAGMFEQPASFTVTVPAGATVNQVLLYWEAGHRHGDTSGDEPDSNMRINGIDVNAEQRIGGETFFYGSATGDVFTATHRTDITMLGVVGAGESTITVDGLDIDEVTDGAGVLVIYSEPGKELAELTVVDGNDVAFVNFEAPRDATVPQTFTFTPADVDRTATLAMMVSSIHDPVPGCNCRPNFLEYTVAGQTTSLPDPFPDTQGREFDSGVIEIAIPAGASEVTVEMISDFFEGSSDLPASLVWLSAALAVPPAPQPPPTTPPPTVPPVSVSPEVLPFTGPASTTLPVLTIGLMALALGAVVLVARRSVA